MKGIKNAFKNAGKWALVGAGIGTLIVPVVGTIVGGLAGAVIGGILGWIGGEKLAKGFDGLGAWFYKQFSDLVLGPIKAVWDFIAPDWAKSVTDKMEWSDLLPPGLTKLFNGEYFTFDFPKFEWYDIFPKFLVDLFKAGMKGVKEADFKWTDLMPKFLVKFFSGEYDKEGSFEWSDLLPEFITKIIGVAKTAWADTPFTWRSLVPNFIRTEDMEFQQPAILFIGGGNALDNSHVQDLIEWRHKQGYITYTVSTSQTGTSANNIKNYIEDAYNDFEPKPEFITLLGDAGGSFDIPASSVTSSSNSEWTMP